MDIKSRSNNPNSEKEIDTKKASDYTSVKPKRSVIFIILSLILLSIAFMFFCEYRAYDNSSDNSSSYIHNIYTVREETVRYSKNLNRFYVYFKNFDVSNAYKVMRELDEKIGSFNSNSNTNIAESQIIYSEEGVYEDTYDYSNPTSLIEKPPESYYAEDTAVYNPNASYSQLVEQYNNLDEKIKNYEDIKTYLDKNNDFVYHIKNVETGEEFSNSADFANQSYEDIVDINDDIFRNETFNGQPISSAFNRNRLECHIMIPTLQDNQTGAIAHLITKYYNEMNMNNTINGITPIIILIALICSIYTILKHKKSLLYYGDKFAKIHSKIPFIFKLGASLLCLFLIIESPLKYTSSISNAILYKSYGSILFFILMYCCIFAYSYIFITYAFSILRSPKLLKNEPEIKFISNSLRGFNMMAKSENVFLIFLSIILILITLIAWSILFIIFINSYGGIEAALCIIAGIIVGLIAVCFIKLISAHNKLTYYISEMSLGNLDTIPKITGLFSGPINNLNNISDGIKISMQKMLKNERLKTELITNVSHDLKTPLTSIISYVDLLKELRLNDQKAIEYIEILDKKSERLKFLIEDLFEASKLSTGHAELSIESADIVELLKQTMGELSNKISESEISFKLLTPDHIYLNIDGKRMWRVFENLLTNILKYSQQGSRAYINIEDNLSTVTITMKNISSYELDFDPNELFERFKRADVARTTEGSGLGLSIAKNIVELHGGTMDIVIDGDLFKVVIILKR